MVLYPVLNTDQLVVGSFPGVVVDACAVLTVLQLHLEAYLYCHLMWASSRVRLILCVFLDIIHEALALRHKCVEWCVEWWCTQPTCRDMHMHWRCEAAVPMFNTHMYRVAVVEQCMN